METQSGLFINLMNPDPDTLLLEDIRFSLGNLARFTGHASRTYTVLEHSINCFLESKARGHDKPTQFLCFAHDWTEAYLGDVSSPVKALCPSYQELESHFQTILYRKFNVHGNFQLLKTLDKDMGGYEAQAFMPSKGIGPGWHIPSQKMAANIDFSEARDLLLRFDGICRDFGLPLLN